MRPFVFAAIRSSVVRSIQSLQREKTVSINRNSISEDRMDRFDSALTVRQRSGGLGSRLSAVMTMLLALFAASSVAIAQPQLTHVGPTPPAGPFVQGEICAGEQPDFEVITDLLDQIGYNAVEGANALEAEVAAIDIPVGVGAGFIGDDQVFWIDADDIAAQNGGNPFVFYYYGEPHDLSVEGLFLGTNGFVRFQDGDPTNDANVEFFETGIVAQNIPAAGGPNGAIYFLNLDLAPQDGFGEDIDWEIQDVNGDPALVITFRNVSQYDPNLNYPYEQTTVQLIIYPDNHGANANEIEVRLDLWPDPGVIPDRNHTIGVENICGTAATAADDHNNNTWDDALNGDNGDETQAYSVIFQPQDLGTASFNARLVSVGGNLTENTYNLTAAQGDDAFRSATVGGTTGTNLAITASNVLQTTTVQGDRTYYAVIEFENCAIAITNTVEITVNPTPTQTTITGDAAVCVGDLEVYSVPLTNGNTYEWTTSDGAATVNPVGATLNANQVSITFGTGSNAGTAQTVTCVETTPVGCQTTHTVKNVTVYSYPNGTIAGPAASCAGSTNNDYTITGGPYATYQWSITNMPLGTTTPLGTTGATFRVNWGTFSQPALAVNAAINCTVTNGVGVSCQFVATPFPVTVNPLPPTNSITISDATPCVNQTITYTANTQTPGNSYAWNATGGTFVYVTPGGYVNNTPTVDLFSVQIQWTNAGPNRRVTLTESTPAGCSRVTQTAFFPVEALPTPFITGPSINVCGFVTGPTGSPLYQTVPTPRQHIYSVLAPVAGNTYAWTIPAGSGAIVAVNNGTIAGGALSASGVNCTQITVQWTNPAAVPGFINRNMTLTETSLNGCIGSDPGGFDVEVVHSPVAGDFSMTGPGIASTGPCANTTGVVYNGATTLVGASHEFYVLAGGTEVSQAAASVTVNWGNAAPGSTSEGLIRHEILSADGCTAWEDYTIDILPLPDADITGPATVCGGTQNVDYTTTNVANGPITANSWSLPINPGPTAVIDGASNAATVRLDFNNPVSQTLVTLQNIITGPAPGNCTNTITFIITVNPTPAAPLVTGPDGGPGDYLCAGETYNYVLTGTASATTVVSVTNGTPSQTVFVGAGPHNFSVTWGLVPAGGNGNINAITTLNNCPSAPFDLPVVIEPLPDVPFLQYSLDGIIWTNTVPPLCVNTLPFYIRVQNSQAGVTYNWNWGPSNTFFWNGVINTVGPGINDILEVTFWDAPGGLAGLVVDATDLVTGCTRVAPEATWYVAPVPTPVITGPDDACNNIYDPNGANGAAMDVDVEAFLYDYTTPYVAGNSYSWTVTNGYIIGYSVNGGAFTFFNPVQTTTGGPILGANTIRVAFYGNTPGAVKVSEIAPGGCQFTTLDYLVDLNDIPVMQDIDEDSIDICSLDDATFTLNGSEVGYTYRVEISPDFGASWNVASTPTQVGTGGSLTFTVPAADIPYTATPVDLTTYWFRVRAQTPAPPAVCGWYPVSDTLDVDVNPKPAANIPVDIEANEVCEGDDVVILVGENGGIGSEPWVVYRLQRRQIADLVTGAAIPPTAWVYVGSAANGNGGELELYDDTNPAGGHPLITIDNYEYQVEAVSDMSTAPNPEIQCTTFLTETTDARVFALPIDPVLTITPNPVCWEEDVTINLGTTQEGVQYEILIGGSSIGAPFGPIILDGTGGNVNYVVNSAAFQPTNPVGLGSVMVTNIVARSYLSNYGPYSRPIPVGGCPTDYSTADLEVLEKPVAVINGPDTVCGPSTTDYTPNPVTPAPGYYDWLITGTPDAAPAGTTPLQADNVGPNTVDPYTVNWGVNLLSCDGSYNPLTTTIRLIATNANGCTDTAFKEVTINPTVNDAEITGDDTACIYAGYEEHLESYVIERPGGCVFPPGTEFLWEMPTGVVSGAIRSGQFTDSIVAEWYTTGGTNIGTVMCTVTLPDSVGGCVTVRTFDVVVYPLPQPVIAGPDDVCQGEQDVVYTADNYPSDLYFWEILGGIPEGGNGSGVPGDLGNISGVGLNIITVDWLNEANLNAYIKLTQTSVAGCMNETVFYVDVHPTPVPAIDGPAIVCDNSVVYYSTANNAPNNVYSWTIADNATILSGSNQAMVEVLTGNYASGTSFTLTLTETVQGTGCETTVQRTIDIVETPDPEIVRISPLPGMTGGACLGQEVEYGDVDPVLGSYSYKWTVQNGNINPLTPDNGSTIKVTWNTVGTGTVTLMKWHTGTQCTTTVSQDVNITEIPQPAIAGPTVVCGDQIAEYSTPFVVGNTYAWTVSGDGALVSGANANSVMVEFSNPAGLVGAATITVVETNTLSGCFAEVSENITVNYMPQADIIDGPTPVCNNDVATYSIQGEPAGLDYLWQVTGGLIIADNGSSIDVDWVAEGNQTITVTISNPGTNCEKTIEKVVTVEYDPNPAISGDAIVCEDEVEIYSTPYNAGSSYVWTVTGGIITSGQNSNVITVEWTTPGVQQITVTESNASGNCVAVAILEVTVYETPAADGIVRLDGGNVKHACEGYTYDYGTNAANPQNFDWHWQVTGGQFETPNDQPEVSVKWTLTGNQLITVTITTPGTDCELIVEEVVAVTPTPQPNIDGAVVACINKDHVYQTTYVPGNTYVWEITPSNVFAPITGYPNSNVIEVKWIQPGLHTVTLTETSQGGDCETTVSIQVQVNLIPEPFITSTTGYGNPAGRRPGIVCNFSQHTYTTFATPGNTFIWTVDGGTIVSGQYTNTIEVLWGPSGWGTIAVEETIPGSDCITTDTDTIDIRPTPSPVITGNFNPCGNSVQVYSTPHVEGNTHNWTVVGGSIIAVNGSPIGATSTVTGQHFSQITVRWNNPTWPNTLAGSLKVVEWVTDVLPFKTCIDSTTQAVTVRPNPPVPTITGPSVVCATDLNDNPPTINEVIYTTSVPVTNSGTGSLSFSWSVSSNGTIVGSTTGTSIRVRWTNTTSVPQGGTVTVTHTSSFGCATPSTLPITINPLPNPNISGPTSVCQNSLHTYSTPGFPGHAYDWTVSGGNIIRSGQGSPNVTVEWTLPGTYTLTVSETNIYDCEVFNELEVTVNELPSAIILASGSTNLCQGQSVTLEAPVGFASYVWSNGATSRSIVVQTPGDYFVYVTDENGCSNVSNTITVNFYPSSIPEVSLSAPTTFCEGGSVTLTAPGGFDAYLWSTGETTQSITVTQTGSYTVTVMAQNGCTATSAEVDVFVNPKPAPTLTVVGSTTVCAGDNVEVRAPQGYVSYTWVSTSGTNYGTDRSIFVEQTDTIYCQVVDANGCVGESDTIVITVTPSMNPTITPNGPTTFCEGGSVTLEAPAGFATYFWSNGATTREITVEDAGQYTVTVTNSAACLAVSAATDVNVNPLPARPTITRTGDVLFAVTTVAEAYQWYRNGVMIPGAVDNQLVVSLPGQYRVAIADNNTCESISDAFDVILTDVAEEGKPIAGNAMYVFPNPTSGQFTVETEIAAAGSVKIELVNNLGEVVMTVNEFTSGGLFSTSVDMGTLASGVYNVILTTSNERWTVQLVRQ